MESTVLKYSFNPTFLESLERLFSKGSGIITLIFRIFEIL